MKNFDSKFLHLCEATLYRYQQGGFLAGDYVKITKNALNNPSIKEMSDQVREIIKTHISSPTNLRISYIKSSNTEAPQGPINAANVPGKLWADVIVEYAPGMWKEPLTLPLEILEKVNVDGDMTGYAQYPEDIVRDNNYSNDSATNVDDTQGNDSNRQLATSNTKLSTGVNPKITTGKINETFKALRENDLMFEAYTDSLESTPVNGQHYCKVCDQYCDCTEVDGDLICQTCNNKITEDNNESENDPALNTKVDEETLISLVDDPEELANHLSELKTESEDKLKSALNFLTTGGYTTALDRAINFAQER